MTHYIPFRQKFCQSQFDAQVWGPDKHWEKSFSDTTSTIIFDLTILEWISTEQIAFLFAWIRNLKHESKTVIVRLPFRYLLTSYPPGPKLPNLLSSLKLSPGVVADDSAERINRRKTCGSYLLTVYGLLDKVGLKEADFEHMTEPAQYFKESKGLSKNNHQVIPFTTFEFPEMSYEIKYDTHFYEIIGSNLHASAKAANIFDLQNEIATILRKYACYSPFESKILSNVITQELYLNSLQHSFEKPTFLENQITECYITAFLSNKWDTIESKNWVPSFLDEKYPETLNFYRDKEAIVKLLNATVAKEEDKNGVIDISSFELFANKSYLEYIFLDFGQGIEQSLEQVFSDALKEEELINHPELSGGFENAGLPSQILEYAFLLDTSRNPLDKNIEYYDLVPRGLFFLLEMVRRYRGLLIVRSGNGKVVYDFSPQVIFDASTGKYALKEKKQIIESINHVALTQQEGFAGTMYTIILPEKSTAKISGSSAIPSVRRDTKALSDYSYHLEASDFQLASHPLREFHPNYFEYASVLLLYNDVISELKDSEDRIATHHIYNRLFKKVNDVLDAHLNKNSIVFFDFAGLRTGSVLWIKILYLFMITPKINESCRVIVVNLPPDEDKLIANLKENIINTELKGVKRRVKIPEPYLYKPIPCIRFKFGATNEEELVEFIGLKNKDDGDLLTSLLLGHRENYTIDRFASAENTEASLFVKNADRIYSTFSGLENMKDRFFPLQAKKIADFLKESIESKPDEKTGEPLEVYLSSNGGYQFQYLTLYEILHDKYVARFFAKCLLDNYCSHISQQVANGTDINNFSFSKIVTVTVSSQLIGSAIRSLIEEDSQYSFLKGSGVEPIPDLIMLSSYYSFDSEKPFEKLLQKDRVLIVNDVISTGALVKKLIHNIDSVKKIPITAIFSVADTRIPNHLIDEDRELSCEDFKDTEIPFFTLCGFKDGLEIRKYKGPYPGKADVKRINPLLNTIVGLKARHGEPQKILYTDPKSFINDPAIASSYLKIGHFQQNLTHNGYLTDMRPLFASDAGVNMLKKMKRLMDEEYRKYGGNLTNELVNFKLVDMEHELGSLMDHLPGNFGHHELELLQGGVRELRDKLANEMISTGHADKYLPDFIFYPVLSGIEKMSHFRLSEIFGTHPDNIIALHRFDTPKGWRFPFPAKRYNELTKGKSVLIIDSGSLTGESLIQLVDNVGFLDIKEIVVLSIITRIEDFNREFYSRLKSLKVKHLRSKAEKNSTSVMAETIIPINIMFGVCLHIPVYPSSTACPFCTERAYLDSMGTKTHFVNPPKDVEAYKNKRLGQLNLEIVSKDDLSCSGYLPLTRETQTPDIKGQFITRDLLGQIDSYRFYPEYFTHFKDLTSAINRDPNWYENKNIKHEIELILACILHEPPLYDLINSLVNDLAKPVSDYLEIIISNPDFKTYFEWKKIAVVKLVTYTNLEKLFGLDSFEKLLLYADDDACQFIQFKLWDILYSRRKISEQKTRMEVMLLAFDKKHGNPATSPFPAELFRNIARILSDYYQYQPLEDEFLGAPFYNLKKFFLDGKNQTRHFILKSKLNSLIESLTDKQPKLIEIKSHLKEIWDICESNLKPNLDRILEDPQIPVYHKLIEAKFGRSEKGMLHFIDELEKISDAFDKLSQEQLPAYNEELNRIAKFCVALVEDVFSSTDNVNFFSICSGYPCNYFEELEKTKKHDWITLEDDKPPTEIMDSTIAMHTSVFTSIVDEIINNAARAYENKKVHLRISRVISDNTVRIRFKQDEPFFEQGRRSGLVNNVKHFTEQFGGDFIDNSEMSATTGSEFIIDLLFRKHKYINHEKQQTQLNHTGEM